MRRRFSRFLWSGVAAAFILSCAAPAALAQYLEQSRSYAPSDARFASAGIFARDFRPRGTNTASESLAVSYTRVMPLVGFRQGPVDFLFGYTTYDLHGAARAAIYFGVTFTGDYILSGNREQALVLPFVVDADFTKSESAGTLHDNFDVGSIGVGTGLKSGEMSWQTFSRFGSGNASMRVAMAWSLTMKTGTLYLRAMLTASMAV